MGYSTSRKIRKELLRENSPSVAGFSKMAAPPGTGFQSPPAPSLWPQFVLLGIPTSIVGSTVGIGEIEKAVCDLYGVVRWPPHIDLRTRPAGPSCATTEEGPLCNVYLGPALLVLELMIEQEMSRK